LHKITEVRNISTLCYQNALEHYNSTWVRGKLRIEGTWNYTILLIISHIQSITLEFSRLLFRDFVLHPK